MPLLIERYYAQFYVMHFVPLPYRNYTGKSH
jgi:hypothetical protein